MGNTGNKIYQTLIEKLVSNNQTTGFTKPNVNTDTDYIPPVVDTLMCVPETTTTTTTPIPPVCGSLIFNSGAYFEIETESAGNFVWNLPINISSITSIVSWSLRVQTSQTCRTNTGFIYSNLDSWDVTVNGSSGTPISSLSGDGIDEIGDINNGSFVFDPLPNLALTPNPCGGTRKVWQEQTIITLDITYLDLCSIIRTYHAVSYIPEYRVTLTVGSSGTCLLENTRILLANNDEKLIQNIVEGDVLRGIKVSKEKFHYDTFKDSHFIHVEVEKITDYEVEELIDILDLHMTPTHKHLVLRKDTTCFVVEAKDIVKGDKIYNFEEMKFKEVKEIKIITGKFKVYNIEIKGPYKFYFANNQLTHNKTVPPYLPLTTP